MKLAFALIALAALTGCGTMNQPFANMSAEQISAAVKEKDANATFVSAPTPWGTAKTVWISIDAGVIKNGSFSVDGNGTVTFSNAPVAAPGTTTTTTVTVPK